MRGPACLLLRRGMTPRVRADLLPQVPPVISKFFLADHHFAHFAGFVFNQSHALALVPAGHAALVKRRVPARRALRLLFLFLVSADCLVQLFASVQRIEPVVIDALEVFRKPDDVAGVVD